MTTVHSVLDRFEVDTSLVEDLEIPVLTGLQRQGDVIVVPQRPGADAGTPVPASGIAVVRGENGGNTHLLVAVEGEVFWRQITTTDRLSTDLGVLTVPEGSVAGLLHPEHGGQFFGAGTYGIKRQRQQAEVIAVVSD